MIDFSLIARNARHSGNFGASAMRYTLLGEVKVIGAILSNPAEIDPELHGVMHDWGLLPVWRSWLTSSFRGY